MVGAKQICSGVSSSRTSAGMRITSCIAETGGKLASFPWLPILGLQVAAELEKGCANGLSFWLTFAGLSLGTNVFAKSDITLEEKADDGFCERIVLRLAYVDED